MKKAIIVLLVVVGVLGVMATVAQYRQRRAMDEYLAERHAELVIENARFQQEAREKVVREAMRPVYQPVVTFVPSAPAIDEPEPVEVVEHPRKKRAADYYYEQSNPGSLDHLSAAGVRFFREDDRSAVDAIDDLAAQIERQRLIEQSRRFMDR